MSHDRDTEDNSCGWCHNENAPHHPWCVQLRIEKYEKSEKRLKAEVRRLRTFVEYVRNRVERTSPVIDFTRGGLASFALSAALRPAKRGSK